MVRFDFLMVWLQKKNWVQLNFKILVKYKEKDALYEKEKCWHQNDKRGQDERTANGYNLMGKKVDENKNLRSSKSEESRNKK